MGKRRLESSLRFLGDRTGGLGKIKTAGFPGPGELIIQICFISVRWLKATNWKGRRQIDDWCLGLHNS